MFNSYINVLCIPALVVPIIIDPERKPRWDLETFGSYESKPNADGILRWLI